MYLAEIQSSMQAEDKEKCSFVQLQPRLCYICTRKNMLWEKLRFSKNIFLAKQGDRLVSLESISLCGFVSQPNLPKGGRRRATVCFERK